jgi:hypothetical protein
MQRILIQPHDYLATTQFSILEVAVHPSYSNFFLETWQKRPFCHLCLLWVATGCILFLQAVRFQAKRGPTYLSRPSPSLI